MKQLLVQDPYNSTVCYRVYKAAQHVTSKSEKGLTAFNIYSTNIANGSCWDSLCSSVYADVIACHQGQALHVHPCMCNVMPSSPDLTCTSSIMHFRPGLHCMWNIMYSSPLIAPPCAQAFLPYLQCHAAGCRHDDSQADKLSEGSRCDGAASC